MVVMTSVMVSSLLLLGSTLLVVNSTEAWPSSIEKNLHPVIYIPGLGGSQLKAKIDEKLSTPSVLCRTKSSEFTIWLDYPSAGKLTPLAETNFGKCWVDNMRLVYNNATRTTSNVQGVTLSVPDFGDPYTVETLQPETLVNKIFRQVASIFPPIRLFGLFTDISFSLEEIGLKRNVNIKGAPYDFRKAPNEQKEYFLKLKTLIEETYHKNGNTSVVLLAHSMGGPMTLHFLRQQKQEWKDKFIKSLISLAASWGGSVKSMKAYAEGDNLDISIFSIKQLKFVLTTMPSMAWMMPSPQFWGKDEVLVSTSKRNYTVYDMKDFFYDAGEPTAWEMYQDVVEYTSDLGPPGVEVHCLYGSEAKSTLEQLRYDELNNYNQQFSHLKGYGDGTVNRRSLMGCSHWGKLQKMKVRQIEFAHLGHLEILHDKRIIKYIQSVVKGEI